MDISEAVRELELYQKHQAVSDAEASNIMGNLMVIQYYPDNFVITGGLELALIYNRYGGVVTYNVFKFLEDVFAGRLAITQLNFDERFPPKIQQDQEFTSVIFSLYFRVWMELRNNNMEFFPYRLAKVGKTGGLYIRTDKFQLLQCAGL